MDSPHCIWCFDIIGSWCTVGCRDHFSGFGLAGPEPIPATNLHLFSCVQLHHVCNAIEMMCCVHRTWNIWQLMNVYNSASTQQQCNAKINERSNLFTTDRLQLLFWQELCAYVVLTGMWTQQHVWSSNRCTFNFVCQLTIAVCQFHHYISLLVIWGDSIAMACYSVS